MSNRRPIILTVSHDQRVLETGTAVLRSVGWEAVGTMDDVEALSLVVDANVDAVVLGDSIDCRERTFLAQTLKRMNPEVRVVMMYRENDGVFDDTAADANILSLSSPQLLIDTLRHLLGGLVGQRIAS
jgi:DNA-binding NtrC family response regulator